MNLFLVLIIVTAFGSIVMAEEAAEQTAGMELPDLPPPPAIETPVEAESSDAESATDATASVQPVAPPVSELPPVPQLEVSSEQPESVDSASAEADTTPEPAVSSSDSEEASLDQNSASALIPVAEAAQPVSKPADTLFSAAPAAGSVPDKVLFEQSEQDEYKAREVLDAIEKLKEQKLEAYLAFDAELDEFFAQAGLARGTAAADITAVKKAMVEQAQPGAGVNDAAQAAVTEQAPLIEAVMRDMKMLQDREADVIRAVKTLSDVVLALGDSMVQIQTQRIEMTASTDHAVIVALNMKIKEAAAKIATAQTSLNVSQGELKAVDDALAKGREYIGAAQKNIDALKAKNIHIAELLQKLRVETNPAETDAAVEEEEIDSKKKNEEEGDSWLMNMVRGTVFEAPYCVIADTVLTVWHASQPAREAVVAGVQSVYQGIVAMVDKDAARNDMIAQAQEEPLADPVLERIRLERLQSKQRVAELAQQREIIEMKDTLLDRLEAERVMQLDTKHDIEAELGRAYARHDRELTWVGLFKRLAWKTYASTRRLIVYVYRWMNGLNVHTGLSEEGRGVEKDDTI
jgi:hypothetical protein